MRTTCPRCGSSETRLLAPGYFECEGEILVDVVPRGAHGNASEIPVRRRCGHRFQSGASGTQTAQCACGMFAVGVCQTCAQPSCGEHGSIAGGRFLCNAHIVEARRRAAAEQSRRDAEKRRQAEEVARQAAEQRAEMFKAREETFPEFPVGRGATVEQLSAGLRKYAPGRKQSFVVERKSLGRTKTVRGWGFAVGTAERSKAHGKRYYSHSGLIVTDDGHAYKISDESTSPEWAPGDHSNGPPPRQIDSVSAREAQIVIGCVLAWAGKPRGGATTPARTAHLEQLVENGRITREEAERIAPDGRISDAAWAAIRDR